MHRNEIFYALICINNRVLSCLFNMLSGRLESIALMDGNRWFLASDRLFPSHPLLSTIIGAGWNNHLTTYKRFQKECHPHEDFWTKCRGRSSRERWGGPNAFVPWTELGGSLCQIFSSRPLYLVYTRWVL